MKKFKNLPAYFVGKKPTDQEILDAVIEMCTEPVSSCATSAIKDMGAEGKYYPAAKVHVCYIGNKEVSIYRHSHKPGNDFPMFYSLIIC